MKRYAWALAILGFVVLISLIVWNRRSNHAVLDQADLSHPRIYAYRDWQSVGIQVKPGDMVHIRAQGSWSYTPDEFNGPEGHNKYAAIDTYPINATRGGVLLGRIGEMGAPFIVGKGVTQYIQQAGTLYFRINDDILSDNKGYVNVEVVLTSPD